MGNRHTVPAYAASPDADRAGPDASADLPEWLVQLLVPRFPRAQMGTRYRPPPQRCRHGSTSARTCRSPPPRPSPPRSAAPSAEPSNGCAAAAASARATRTGRNCPAPSSSSAAASGVPSRPAGAAACNGGKTPARPRRDRRDRATPAAAAIARLLSRRRCRRAPPAPRCIIPAEAGRRGACAPPAGPCAYRHGSANRPARRPEPHPLTPDRPGPEHGWPRRPDSCRHGFSIRTIFDGTPMSRVAAVPTPACRCGVLVRQIHHKDTKTQSPGTIPRTLTRTAKMAGLGQDFVSWCLCGESPWHTSVQDTVQRPTPSTPRDVRETHAAWRSRSASSSPSRPTPVRSPASTHRRKFKTEARPEAPAGIAGTETGVCCTAS